MTSLFPFGIPVTSCYGHTANRFQFSIDQRGPGGEFPLITLLSYPRSGSHWLCYCLEYITKNSTNRRGREVDKPGFDWPASPNNSISETTHFSRAGLSKPLRWNVPRILLVRNFKECVVAHAATAQKGFLLPSYALERGEIIARPPEKYKATDPVMQTNVCLYAANVYDHFALHEENKVPILTVHYEDILLDFEKTMHRVIEWICEYAHAFHAADEQGLSKSYKPLTKSEMLENLRTLVNDLDSHKQKCLAPYKKWSKHGKSNGKSVIYHSSGMNEHEKLTYDDTLITYLRHSKPSLDVISRYLEKEFLEKLEKLTN
tara:strand:- start:1448 stop:2398 length:951 start_codon:yes stop_codon:yes gene_type:complete